MTKTILTSIFGTLIAASNLYAAERPNILWLSTEDIGPHIRCYGDDHARTPNLDAVAACNSGT